MAKSQVEKYEQILAQDPTSTVFVELAKTLIAEGDLGRAITVCEAGLIHHPRSVAGRVLWGKALIHQGRPAQAMEQFDRAIAIHKDNPHAYNLISEVLVQKGLYRSALPLLRKAVALQPNDARVRGWLDQTQQALSGGPAPVLGDWSPAEELESQASSPAQAPKAEPAGRSEPGASVRSSAADLPFDPEATQVQANPFNQMARASGGAGLPDLSLGGDEEVIPGLTSVFQALSPGGAPPPTLASESSELVLDGRELMAEPEAPAPSPQSFGLLGDLPEASGMFSAEAAAAAKEVSHQATAEIAQEYERELRVQVEKQIAQKTFLQLHGWKLAVGGTLTLALAVAGFFYVSTRAANHGQDLQDALASAKKGILQDAPETERAALKSLELAVRMAPTNPEPRALAAYAHALLFADVGETEHLQAAKEALAFPGVRERFGHLALASDYYLAEGKNQEEARAKVMESTEAKAELLLIQGRIHLERKQMSAAVDKLKQALVADARSVRALSALANYFKGENDCPQAQELYERALQVSPRHPEAVLGVAECQLDQEQELEATLGSIQKVAPQGLGSRLGARRALDEGKLLSALGRHSEALAKLEAGVASFPDASFEFNLALGKASFAAGKLETAQKSFEAAFKLRPHSEEVKEALGRLLLARGKYREVLSRINAEGAERKVFLVRGIAAAKAGDARTARAEFSRTQVKGKVPQEAVVHLALLDAADGEVSTAQQTLEKMLKSAKRRRTEIQLALGKLYLQQKQTDKAREQFEAAAKDPLDSEGSAALGQMLLDEKNFEAAIPLLRQAANRNPALQEARVGLVDALLNLGQREEALKEAQSGVDDNAGAAPVQRVYAAALRQNGKLKEAEKASALAVKLDGNDPEAHRVRAAVLFSLGEGQAAFGSLERANKLNSKDPKTFCEIGLALLRQGHADYALQAYDAAKREGTGTPCTVWGPLWTRLPFASRATIGELEALLKGNLPVEDRAMALATLARSLANSGGLKEARKAADDALTLAPWSGMVQYALGLTAQRQKDDEHAKSALAQAAALEPSYGQVRLAYADLLVRGEGPEQAKALKEYEAFLAAGGHPGEMSRVKKSLPQLRKRLASR